MIPKEMESAVRTAIREYINTEAYALFLSTDNWGRYYGRKPLIGDQVCILLCAYGRKEEEGISVEGVQPLPWWKSAATFRVDVVVPYDLIGCRLFVGSYVEIQAWIDL